MTFFCEGGLDIAKRMFDTIHATTGIAICFTSKEDDPYDDSQSAGGQTSNIKFRMQAVPTIELFESGGIFDVSPLEGVGEHNG